MTFGKPRYNKNYTWELLRLCTNNKYKIVVGFNSISISVSNICKSYDILFILNSNSLLIFSWNNKSENSKLELKNIPKQEANEFLDRYHLQNRCNGNIINLGLCYNNELVQIMTFKSSLS